MNFHKLIFKNPIIILVIIAFVLFAIINIKYWWATAINCIISISLLIVKFPRIGNHSTIILVFSIALIILFFLKFIHWKVNLDSDFISYFFRIFIVTVYFYTGFHKLNSDFFNPCVSCVNEINNYTISNFINSRFVITSNWSRFFQFFTIFIEMILPFGLLFHKTRKYSGIALLVFHFYLSFSVFADFSLIALFLIFGSLIDFNKKNDFVKLTNAIKIYLIFIIASVLSTYFMQRFLIDLYKFSFYNGVIYSIGFGFLLFVFIKKYYTRIYYYKKSYNRYLILIVFIISFWTLKTYIGLGNAGNLTMFSNLVTEKENSNHLIFDTRKLKLFDFEEDNIELLYLKNSNIKENFVGYKIPVVEFNYLVHYWCENYKDAVSCKLIYKGKIIEIKDLRKSQFNNCKWWYKYLFFRKIQVKGPNECRW